METRGWTAAMSMAWGSIAIWGQINWGRGSIWIRWSTVKVTGRSSCTAAMTGCTIAVRWLYGRRRSIGVGNSRRSAAAVSLVWDWVRIWDAYWSTAAMTVIRGTVRFIRNYNDLRVQTTVFGTMSWRPVAFSVPCAACWASAWMIISWSNRRSGNRNPTVTPHIRIMAVHEVS